MRKSFFAIAALIAGAGANAQTNVNVAHLAPFDSSVANTAVSVDLDSTPVPALDGVVFNQVSGYLEIAPAGTPPGVTQIDVRNPPGGAIAISASPDLAADTDYTVAAIGNVVNQPLELLPLVDDLTPPTPENVKLRVVHAAPFADTLAATEVSIRLQNGTVVNGLTNVPYKGDSGFFELPEGTYDLVVATPDGSANLIDPLPVTLNAGDIVTVFAVGDGANQPLGITAVFGDGSFASLPLAGDGADSAQSIPTLSNIGIMILMLVVGLVAWRRLI